MRGQKRDATIETNVIKVFEEQSTSYDRGGGSELRIIAWIVNGSEKSPQLERREWWMSEDGTRRPGKAKGFSVNDFEFILKNREAIGQFMGMPARFVKEAIDTIPVTEGVPTAEATSSSGRDGW